jgi:hypothetical protein
MIDLNLQADIAARYQPFLEFVLAHQQEKIHSVYIVGSALTADYDPKSSDINSVIVLHKMDFKFLELLAPVGKKFGKKQVAAPLIMTPAYIEDSQDVFPIEFLNIQLHHHTVWGEDIFKALNIRKSDLRHQCERELKVKLIGLRQGYLSAAGNQKVLASGFAASFAGYMPLFKAIIDLLGRQPPQNNQEILAVLQEVSGVRMDVFQQVLGHKKQKTKPSGENLKKVFKNYYAVIEQLGELVNALEE